MDVLIRSSPALFENNSSLVRFIIEICLSYNTKQDDTAFCFMNEMLSFLSEGNAAVYFLDISEVMFEEFIKDVMKFDRISVIFILLFVHKWCDISA